MIPNILKFKKLLKDEGNETVTNCNALKLEAYMGTICPQELLDTKQAKLLDNKNDDEE